MAKILFLLAVGVLFSHQLMAHDHHDHHFAVTGQATHTSDGDNHSIPDHSLDHVFSLEKKAPVSQELQKDFFLVTSYLYVCLQTGDDRKPPRLKDRDTPVLLTNHYTTPSRRGPPAC